MPRNTPAGRVFERAREMGVDDQLLSRWSGVEVERLGGLRKGASMSALEFEQLCRALAVDPSALYRGEDRSPTRTVARFRAAFSMDGPKAADIQLLALAAEQGRILAHLLSLLGRSVGLEAHREVRGVESSPETWREGYRLGEAAREALWPDRGPLFALERLLVGLGVHVARVHFSSADVHAASLWEPGAVPIVLLNEGSPRLRNVGSRRAVLAHELCHLLHDAGEHDLTTQVSWSTGDTKERSRLIEMRARAFAPAFLAPRSELSSSGSAGGAAKTDSQTVVKGLAERWGLSFEGAAWHAKNCDIIPPDEAERLARLDRKPSVSLEEFEPPLESIVPVEVHPSLPKKPAPLWDGLALKIVLDALEEGHISVGRARELLTWG